MFKFRLYSLKIGYFELADDYDVTMTSYTRCWYLFWYKWKEKTLSYTMVPIRCITRTYMVHLQQMCLSPQPDTQSQQLLVDQSVSGSSYLGLHTYKNLIKVVKDQLAGREQMGSCTILLQIGPSYVQPGPYHIDWLIKSSRATTIFCILFSIK